MGTRIPYKDCETQVVIPVFCESITFKSIHQDTFNIVEIINGRLSIMRGDFASQAVLSGGHASATEGLLKPAETTDRGSGRRGERDRSPQAGGDKRPLGLLGNASWCLFPEVRD